VLCVPLATTSPGGRGREPWPPAPVVAGDTLPVDPRLVVGTLPNGLRYYLRENHAPAGRIELRLVVNAGSALEAEDQRGLAHFLEHMAFNGTTHFPRHALIESLESAGMRFGADINAYTSFDETVYALEVPADDPTHLTRGLQMLADWAGGGITIDPGEVHDERGVIMGEWRSRLLDTAAQAAQRHQDSVLWGGASPYATRAPIGLTSIIRHAEAGPIRRFYTEWYRPDLIAVVVVGDFDARNMERLVRDRFGAIPRATHPAPRPQAVVPSNAAPVVSVYRAASAYPRIEVIWKRGIADGSSVAAYRHELVDDILFDALTQKLMRLRGQDRRPFFQATIGRTSLQRTTDAYVLDVVAQPDSLESGLAAALQEVERTAQTGVPTAMLDGQKEALVRRVESEMVADSAMPSAGIADEYVQRYLRGNTSLMSGAQRLALTRTLLGAITTDDIAAAAAFWRARTNLVVLVSLSSFAHVQAPTRESVLAVFDAVAHARLAPDSVGALTDAAVLASIPSPGRIVSERTSTAAGITEWTLSNGARVLLKPTRSNADELLIDARGPGGFSLVPDSLFFSSGRLVAKMMTEASGIGTLDHSGLQVERTGLRAFNVSISNNDQSISLGGSPRNAEMLMQLLYRQFTAPTLDTASLALWKHVGMDGLAPSLDDQITTVLSRGDPRRQPVPWTLVDFARLDKAMTVYRDRFGNAGEFTFTIVGAVTPTEIRPLVERYIASLPATGKRETPQPLDVRAWNAISRNTVHAFDVPKATTAVVFDAPFPYTGNAYLTARRRLAALGWALRLEFTERLRERMAGTYSVSVQDETYADPDEHCRLVINFDMAPERKNEMLDSLNAVLQTARTRGATPPELQKITAMLRRSRETQLQSNRYWLQAIEAYDRMGIPLDTIATARVPAVTAGDIQGAARECMPATAFIQMTYMPQDSTIRSPSDSVAGKKMRR
jgi:zinc protease